MDWFLLTVLCGFVSSTLILCYRLITPETNPFLFISIVTGIAFFLMTGYNLVTGVSMLVTKPVMLAGMASGIIMAVLDCAFVLMFRIGAPVTIAVPLFRVIGVMLAAFLGVLIFNDHMTPLKILGILTAACAVYLLNKKPKVKT